MGKTRRNIKRKTCSPSGAALTKGALMTENTGPRKVNEIPKVEETLSQSSQHSFTQLLSTLSLWFTLVSRPSSGRCDGGGEVGSEDTCCDVENDEWTETKSTAVKNVDCALGLRCKGCDMVLEMTPEDRSSIDVEKIRNRHNKMSPDCTFAESKDATDLDDVEDSGIKSKAAVTDRRMTSLSDLEMNVVCDTGPDKEEPSSSLSGPVVTDATLGAPVRSLAAALEKDVICDTRPNPMPPGDKSGADSATTQTRTTRPWDPNLSKYPMFSQVTDRSNNLEQFWNKQGFCLNEIADAGLCFLGVSEKGDLNCFFCGVTVNDLHKHDDAWIEHAKRSPDCGYVRHRKGQEYLNVIIDIYLDGDTDAVRKAMDAVAAIKPLNNLAVIKHPSTNNRTSTNNVATSTSVGAIGANYGTTSGPAQIKSTTYDSNLPENFRGGLRGGNPNYSNSHSSQSPPTISRNIPVDRPTGVTIPRTPVTQTTVRKPRQPKRQVQAREVRARLDTDMSQRIIKMGYSAQLVGAVISEQLIYKGDDFRSFTEMMMAVMEASDLGDAFPVNHYDLGLNSRGNYVSPIAPKTEGTAVPRPQSPPKSSQSPPSSPPNPSFEDFKSLENENERLRETKTCTVCYDMERDVLFIPCGHLVVCHNCSPRLKCCPLCRRTISGIVKVFLS